MREMMFFTAKQEKAVREYIEEYKRKLEERRKEVEKITSNNNYITWLENFTNKYTRFSDVDWTYCPTRLSKGDSENVEKLKLFYEAIEKYAEQNSISSESEDFILGNEYYLIGFNSIVYRIGIICGQGTVTYCERVNDISENIIDFNSITQRK